MQVQRLRADSGCPSPTPFSCVKQEHTRHDVLIILHDVVRFWYRRHTRCFGYFNNRQTKRLTGSAPLGVTPCGTSKKILSYAIMGSISIVLRLTLSGITKRCIRLGGQINTWTKSSTGSHQRSVTDIFQSRSDDSVLQNEQLATSYSYVFSVALTQLSIPEPWYAKKLPYFLRASSNFNRLKQC